MIIAYAWLVFFPPLAGVDLLVLKLTGTVAIVAVFAILAWIGYTLATTPSPKLSLDDISRPRPPSS